MLNRRSLMLTGVLAALLSLAASLSARKDERVSVLFSGELNNVPGNSVTAEIVDYPAGGKSGVHHHAGSVFAYVLKGAIRSQNSATGAGKVYKAGESFFEPSGSDHLVSENASDSEPASLLAIHIAPDGAVLTRPGHAK